MGEFISNLRIFISCFCAQSRKTQSLGSLNSSSSSFATSRDSIFIPMKNFFSRESLCFQWFVIKGQRLV